MGETFVRFRLSTEAGLSFDGLAADGEVEDYQVQIASILGDTDGDGDVDFADLSILAGHFTGTVTPPAPPGTAGKTGQQGDFDGDGDVDFADFSILAGHFTGTITAPATALSLRPGRFQAVPSVSL